MIIGICGKSGSGKSTLARQIKELYGNNGIYLEVDKVGHNVLVKSEVKKELVASFGDSIIHFDTIDRKKLGDIVFNSRNEMKKLSDATWKYMQIEIDAFLKENQDKIIILDWLLLPVSKYFDICDIKILLDIPYEIRKKRAIERDHISEETYELREKASIDFNYEDFDCVLQNNDSISVERLEALL